MGLVFHFILFYFLYIRLWDANNFGIPAGMHTLDANPKTGWMTRPYPVIFSEL